MGLAQGAYNTALAYAQQREQFGRPIMEFQGIQWKIADMATQLHAARLMVYRAAMSERGGYVVGGGTVEILRNTLAALEFGRSFDQRRG